MTACVALLRGINVGRAKRIAMADLRRLFVDLGYADVRTLLNSGNVVFTAPDPDAGRHALAIRAGIARELGLAVPVVVVTAADLAAILRENPLHEVAVDPAKHLVAFVSGPAVLAAVKPLLKESWAPEALAVGKRAAYLWCAGGVADSKLSQALLRAAGEEVTARNWATVIKIQASIEAGPGVG
jgi:uncharacterized protein (DUF1697 family)